MIRQAISCDLCGTEKRQTNHWFVAYEQAGELRVSGWTSRHRLRAEAKHLCGQTCLHKLMDEFMAKSIASRSKPVIDEDGAASPIAASSRTSIGAFGGYEEVESSARLIPTSPAPSASDAPRSASRTQPGVVAMPPRPQIHTPAPVSLSPISVEPRLSSRGWHAEAWQRERAREVCASENQSGIAARHRSGAQRAF